MEQHTTEFARLELSPQLVTIITKQIMIHDPICRE